MITFENYQYMMQRNLQIMSRTVHGIVDTSASAEKKDSLLIEDGQQAGRIAAKNVERALRFVYENRNQVFEDSRALGEFILRTASIVNDQIVKTGKLMRNGTDSTKYNYVKIADLSWVFNDFCEKFHEKLVRTPYDAVETACFCEYVINGVAHFFADGCNKCSMVISAFCLMRADLLLPEYETREDYYRYFRDIPAPCRNRYVDAESYKNFYFYYKTLFEMSSKNA